MSSSKKAVALAVSAIAVLGVGSAAHADGARSSDDTGALATDPVTVVTPGSDVLSPNGDDGSRAGGGHNNDTLTGSGDLGAEAAPGGGHNNDTLTGSGDLGARTDGGDHGNDVLTGSGDLG